MQTEAARSAGEAESFRRLSPLRRRIGPFTAAFAACALGTATLARNLDYRSVVEMWRKTANQRPENARARLNLGAALLDAGLPDEALPELLTAREIEPDAGLTNLLLGTAYIRLDQAPTALPYLRRAVERLDDPRAYDNLGHALLVTGQVEQSVPCFEQALLKAPRDPEIHRRLAYALAELQRTSAAIEQYREALRLNPLHQEAALALSALMAQLGRGEEALELSRQALAIEPDSAEEHFGLGRSLLVLERYGEAMEAFRDASLKAPEMPEPYAAFAQSALEKPDAKKSELEEALRMAQKANELTSSSRPEFAALQEALSARLGRAPARR